MSTQATDLLDHIRIVMVNTTLPANIGAALRAMKTMGLKHLVLVAPKHYPHPDIDVLSAGASDLIEHIRVVERIEDALADCHVVFGTSARSRTIPWPILDVRPASLEIANATQKNQQVAILFGREDRGLTNEELALANYHLTIPVNPEYAVLNVAQAIQVVCYELRMACLQHSEAESQNHALEKNDAVVTAEKVEAMQLVQGQSMQWDEPLVTQDQMQQFYAHFEQTLADIEFLDPENPRLLPLRLRRLFGRIQLDRMEYHLLRGVFSRVQALRKGTWQPQDSKTATTPNDETTSDEKPSNQSQHGEKTSTSGDQTDV